MPTARILQIISTLDQAGAEKQFASLAVRLPRDEFDVHVCALTRGGPYEEELRQAEIPTTILGKRWKIDPRAAWQLKRLIERLRPDLVQTWMFTANAYGRAAALATGVRTLVASEQCADPWKSWHQLAIDRRLARHTARIVVNGSGVRDFYVAQGIDRDRFVVIPNGIAPHVSSGPSRETLLAELQLPADARLIGVVGRLWPQKRIKDAIWSAELLKAIRDDVHLLIVGDGPERRTLERFRDLVQIEDRVHFLGHRNDVAQMMEHFDALWLASAYEGLPNVLMEAMAARVPVVATDIPGNRDLIEDGRTGFLIPVGDRAALARKTRTLLENPKLARRLGEWGRQKMLDQYPIDAMVDRHAALFRQLLDR